MLLRYVLPLLALGIRLRTRTRVTPAEPVEVLHFNAEVQFVDFESLAKHSDLLNLTQSRITSFIKHTACNSSSPLHEAFMQIGMRGDNASNDTAPGEPAEDPGDEPTCVAPVVRLFGNPFHIHAEFTNTGVQGVFEDADFPKKLSDFLLTVPGVLLYAHAPPICEFASVELKNVTSVIPGCEAHLPKLLSEFRHAYTNRMVPWALNAACGSFSTTLSFATSNAPTEADKVFCQTASHHLLSHHYEGVTFQHEEGRPTDKDYQDWCLEVCEYRHGKTQVCSTGEAGNATNANATAGNATENATALVHHISDAGLFRRIRQVRKH